MQNIGFTYAILPGLKKIIPEKWPDALRRYSTFFNTQPYMAPTAIGVFLHLHEQGDEELIEKIKPSLSGSLAAIGDTFFWSTLKPLLALLLLLSALAGRVEGLFISIIIFDSLHLWTIAWGFFHGYNHGPQGALAIGRILSIDLSRNISLMIPFLCGVLLCYLPLRMDSRQGIFIVLTLFAASVVLLKLRANIFWLVYGVFTLSVLWTILQ
jgi:PTS system mannose-specific IID component